MTISIRLSPEEARELAALAKKTGRSKSMILREAFRQSRSAKADARKQRALALAGSLSGASDLSEREGFRKR
ncbi:MAG: ribbon-helix-helix protein, CopG family [Verrucomicrobia bacterium]|nr:ribbon-helix-helix protein, CopG family [Verrucomicrobiota bacterium]